MFKDTAVQRLTYAATNGRKHSVSELLQQRSSQPLPIRYGKVALSKALHPFIPGSMTYENQTYQFLAAGGEQLVYGNEDEIVKVIYRSFSFDESTVEETTANYQQQYDAASPHLGEHQVGTVFDIRKLRAGLFTTIALQPRLKADKQFADVDELVGYRNDKQYKDKLRKLSASLSGLFLHTGLQVDLNGPNNIVAISPKGEPELRIVDTLPVVPDVQQKIHPEVGRSVGEMIAEKMFSINVAAAEAIPAGSRAVVLH